MVALNDQLHLVEGARLARPPLRMVEEQFLSRSLLFLMAKPPLLH